MNSKVKSAGKKFLAMLLVLMTTLSLCTPALATNGGTNDAAEDYGFLELKVYPYIGGLEPENRSTNARTVSFMSSIYMSRITGEVDPEHSVMGFDVEATWVSSNGAARTVNVWASTNKNTPFSRADFKRSDEGTVTCQVDVDLTLDSQTIYFFAECPEAGASAVISTTVKRYATANKNIRYTRVGMQVRGFTTSDNSGSSERVVSFGQYNYYRSQDYSQKANYINTTDASRGYYASHIDVGEAKDTLTERFFQKCYFYISMRDTEATEDGIKVLSGVSDMAKLYEDIRKWVVTAKDENGNPLNLGNTVELWGPATIRCYNGSQGDKYYSCEYYYPGKADGPDAYASWGNSTKTDFGNLRMQSLIVSININPEIKVNYIDIDTGEILGTDTYGDEANGNTEPSASANNKLKSFHYGSDSVLSAGFASVMQDDHDDARLTQITDALNNVANGTVTVTPDTIIALAPFFTVNARQKLLLLEN